MGLKRNYYDRKRQQKNAAKIVEPPPPFKQVRNYEFEQDTAFIRVIKSRLRECEFSFDGWCWCPCYSREMFFRVNELKGLTENAEKILEIFRRAFEIIKKRSREIKLLKRGGDRSGHIRLFRGFCMKIEFARSHEVLAREALQKRRKNG